MWAYVAAAAFGTPAAWKNFTHESVMKTKIVQYSESIHKSSISDAKAGAHFYQISEIDSLHLLALATIFLYFVPWLYAYTESTISQERQHS